MLGDKIFFIDRGNEFEIYLMRGTKGELIEKIDVLSVHRSTMTNKPGEHTTALFDICHNIVAQAENIGIKPTVN
jgi:hypothetical protein